MERLTLKEITEYTSGRIIKGHREQSVCGVCTDSRRVNSEDLFIPIIGEVNDAHKFLPQVVKAGCRAMLISDEKYADSCGDDAGVILVENTTEAMQSMAKHYLAGLNLLKVGVTGSVGKTSTRDMVYYILKTKYKTGRPIENYNNIYGVPLTIFSLDNSYEAAVFEMGMERFGQIEILADMIRPQVGIITNIGVSHMEHLGTRANIRKSKMQITNFMGNDDLLVINADNDMLDKATCGGNYRLMSVGTDKSCDYCVSDVREEFEGVSFSLANKEQKSAFHLPVHGRHNAVNAGLAVAACSNFGIDMCTAADGIRNMRLTGKRLLVRSGKEVRIIDDSYNASPESMNAALEIIASMPAERRIAILGDMRELGDVEEEAHKKIGEKIASMNIDLLIGVGSLAILMADEASRHGVETVCYPDAEHLSMDLGHLINNGDLILVKASHAVGLSDIADELAEKY